MKKPNKKDTLNLFFSAFLVLAFIICAHFFTQFTSTLSTTASAIISTLLYVVFGLLLFYATRVGDGKAVKRFSAITLIIMVLPSLYIIIASFATGMPLNSVFASDTPGTVSVIGALAGVALGYGIPYTFLSGFEVPVENDDEALEDEAANSVLEGGIEADLMAEEEEADNQADETLEEPAEEVAEPAEEAAESTEEADE